MDFKVKIVCSAKESGKVMKRQDTDQENIFENHISNEGLISRI